MKLSGKIMLLFMIDRVKVEMKKQEIRGKLIIAIAKTEMRRRYTSSGDCYAIIRFIQCLLNCISSRKLRNVYDEFRFRCLITTAYGFLALFLTNCLSSPLDDPRWLYA
jgi:hypothetical protein